MNREDHGTNMDYQPVAPQGTPLRFGKRLLGVGIAVAAAVVLAVVYVLIPPGVRFPAIILGIPAVVVAAGIFQFATGLTILEANSELPHMSRGKQFAVVVTLLVLLGGVLAAFIWFVVATSGV